MKQKHSKLKRRWVKARPGSVLILVIALLVLLALIGTAYLSSTQTERYSAQQNSVNTEADLLVQGVVSAVQSSIVNGLFASTASGVQYRPPGQESCTWPLVNGIPTYAAPPGSSGYSNADSGTTDSWMADRLPVNYSTNASAPNPYWASVSWPLFTDGSGNYSFDSPFDGSANLFLASNKAQLQAYPTYKFVNNQNYPGMIYYLAPSATTIQGSGLTQTSGDCTLIQVQSTDKTVVTGVTLQSPTGPLYVQNSGFGVYITPLGLELATSFNQTIPSTWVNFAASASGDGIADGGMFKLPVGQINNITYYVSTRTIDNTSAVNVSSAWTSTIDPPITNIVEPLQAYNGTPGTGNSNYGFFQSGIGLKEMLQPGSVTTEMNALNAYRFNGILPSGTSSPPTLYTQPIQDETPSIVPRNDFKWSTGGDAFMHQLIARPGNPGYSNLSPMQQFNWMGESASAALAYRFDLKNPNSSPSLIEQILPAETYYNQNIQTTPYAPAQTTQWYNSLFNFTSGTAPLRTILTGSNEVSNAIPSRLGNTSATTPVSWSNSGTYDFGDWVVNNGYSYVCLLHSMGNQPPVPYTVQTAGPEYWTPVPWTNQPIKTSLNTATFDQLWVGFCQTMTDSITAKNSNINNAIPLWQPPMMAPLQVSAGQYNELQMQMFRSTIRDVRNLPISNATPAINNGNPNSSPTNASRLQLTPMQMVQLRAAIAAINVLNMRNAPSDSTQRQVRSHHITLADNNGAPAYDVEVFGTDIQPYIGQMFAQVYTPTGTKAPPGTDTGSFIAIQLLNPYPVAITINSNWGFGAINRANYNNYIGTANAAAPLQVNSLLTAAMPTNMVIPAATANGPSSIVIYDYDDNFKTTGTPPPAHAFQIPTTNGFRVQGLMNAIGKELVILKPRILNGTTPGGTLSSQTSAADTFAEGTSGNPNLYDLVPIDQLDLTGTDQYAKNNAVNNQAMTYYLYKRAADPTVTNSASHASYAWNFTWPGFYTTYNNKYNVISTTGTTTSFRAPQYAPYAQPAATYPFNQPIITFAVPPAQDSITFTGLTSGPASTAGGNVINPTYNTLTLQLNNVGFPGPNPVNQGGNNMFPYGGFARNVDILQVPYIGAYRISKYGTSPRNFYEMNSVTMDSSLANDSTLQPSVANTNYQTLYPSSKVLPTSSGYSAGGVQVTADSVADPFVEQIGRFCPVGDPNHTTTTGQLDPKGQMDFGAGFDTTSSQPGTYWHYHWTRRLFNYFAVQAPHDDYFPNVDPAGLDTTATPNIPVKYPGATNNPVTSSVLPVNNTLSIKPSSGSYYANAQIQNKSEDTTGVEGLININTAPWPVLATLPFVPPNTDNIGYNSQNNPALTPAFPATIPGQPAPQANGVNDNIDLAKAIVDYRNQNGPFKSIMDLYKVPAFRLESEMLLLNDPSVALGDFTGGPTSSTLAPTPDGVRFDFEERYLLLNRISNLITTRADSFTCYVLLQGWRNAGTGNPSLAVERRIAFIIDRNTVTPANNKPAYYKLPSQ